MTKLDRVKIEERTLFAERQGSDLIAAVNYHDWQDEDTPPCWTLSFHNGEMPAHKTLTFSENERAELEREMRKFQADLRYWRFN